MKKNLTLLSLMFLALSSFAQEFEVPQNYQLETEKDYERHEQDVVNAVNWLMNTSRNEQTAKRKKANAFLFAWLSGSPSVSIALSPALTPFTDCADCLMMFMGGWAKYAIETKDTDNQAKGALAGIESVMLFYEKNKATLGKIKSIEKFQKLKSKNKLEKFVETKI